MSLADYAVVPQEIPQFVAGLLVFALAGLLLWVRFQSRLNRAFALYLVLRGAQDVLGAWDDTPAIGELAANLLVYYHLAVPASMVYLALRFRERADRIPLPRWAPLALLAVALVPIGAYAYDHGLYVSSERGGPLYPLGRFALGHLLASLIALLFARRAILAENGSARTGYLLVALGFGLEPAFRGSWLAGLVVRGGLSTSDPYVTTAAILQLAALAATVVTVAMLLWAGRRQDLRVPRSAGLVFFLPIVTALALSASGAVLLGNALEGFWQATLPILVSYAILRHQILGFDVKIRFAISRSTLAGAFVAVFFIASEGAQILFGRGNEWLGLLAAGALVFALAPLQRVAERLAERAVPVSEAGSPSGVPSQEMAYRAAVRRYLRDGGLTREEERELAHLAGELGLHAGRAMEIRHDLADAAGREGSS